MGRHKVIHSETRIRINNKQWRVRVVDPSILPVDLGKDGEPDKPWKAETDYERCVINISADVPAEEYLGLCLHELTHAVISSLDEHVVLELERVQANYLWNTGWRPNWMGKRNGGAKKKNPGKRG